MALSGFYGFKIGMSQIFDSSTRKVVPVTALSFKSWIILDKMTNVLGGGTVLKLGVMKPKFALEAAEGKIVSWRNETPNAVKHAMETISSMKLAEGEDASAYEVGNMISFEDVAFQEGAIVSVSGISRGFGFQGVMKRHGFSGGPKSHGSNFHRTPGSSGSIRSTGKSIKGRRMPGRMGADKVTVQGLEIVKIDMKESCLFVKGAVPGKKNNLIFVRI
jgi:large subunit ribosomal protein L3